MSDLLGVLVGGGLALIGSVGLKFWDGWRDTRALRGAFRAEIAALIDISEIRKHEEIAEYFISQWKAGNNVQYFSFGMDLASRDPVFTANVGRIGSIGRPLAGQVTAFYTRLSAVRISILYFEDPRMQASTPDIKQDYAQAALDIWRKAKIDGVALIAKL